MPSNDISADFQLRLPNVAPLTIDVSSASTEEPASSITASEQSLLGSVRRKLRETRGRGGANCTGTTATPAQKPDRTETLRLNLDAVPVVEADAERKAVGQAAAAKRVSDFKRSMRGASNGAEDVVRTTRAASSQPALPGAAAPAPANEAEVVSGPPCIFKGYSFTSASPPETKYDFSRVPACKPDLSDSVLLRPNCRRQWFVCLKELESLAKESLDRRAARLKLAPPSGLPLVYIADRMDIDDPLWGYQIRCKSTGWLQGFFTATVFTTWTRYFEWDSTAVASGMVAARVANTTADAADAAVTTLPCAETVHSVAARLNLRAADLVAWNASRIAKLHANSRLAAGTKLLVASPNEADTITASFRGQTPKQLAAKAGIATDDFLRLNACSHPSLGPYSRLKPGMRFMVRDRSAEPEVFLPTRARRRALDGGSLAAELQQQRRFGDPMTTGVVWPRVAEIGLLAGLGCGKALLKLALHELRASGAYDFVVLQATMASVSFYEEVGFVRVGAVARYASLGTPLADVPLQGYRHWASADESQVEQFGDTSYMMALRFSDAHDFGTPYALSERLVSNWPSVQSSTLSKKGASAFGNQAGIVGGSAVTVGNMSLNIDDGEDARLQLRFDAERVLKERGPPHALEYLIKWRRCAVHDATWEHAGAEVLKSAAAQAAIASFHRQAGHSQRAGAATTGVSVQSHSQQPQQLRPPQLQSQLKQHARAGVAQRQSKRGAAAAEAGAPCPRSASAPYKAEAPLLQGEQAHTQAVGAAREHKQRLVRHGSQEDALALESSAESCSEAELACGALVGGEADALKRRRSSPERCKERLVLSPDAKRRRVLPDRGDAVFYRGSRGAAAKGRRADFSIRRVTLRPPCLPIVDTAKAGL